MLTRSFLRGWWSKALKRRALFKALTEEDRRYLWLTMKAFDEIRSEEVGTIIVKILAKLKDALKSPFARRMETYGIEKARSISKWAVEWGHSTAGEWANEVGFIRYLTALKLNAPSGWGI
jgi:hypothetical protein